MIEKVNEVRDIRNLKEGKNVEVRQSLPQPYRVSLQFELAQQIPPTPREMEEYHKMDMR